MKKYAAALALGLPFAAHADIALPMTCEMTVKAFFAPLVQSNLIDTKPFKVEVPQSVNHFRPKWASRLVVYGMPVSDVFGYTDEPLLFVRRGEQVEDIYGVIVKEGIANVQAQLSSVGATKARTYRIDGNSTVIFCKV